MKMRHCIRWMVLLLLLLFLASCRISGRIVNSIDSSGLSGVTVTLKSGDETVKETTTDENGDYTFSFISAGEYGVAPLPGTYIFTPESKTVSKPDLQTDVTQVDFQGIEGNIWRPSPGTSWQWQLTGVIDTGYDVDMYDIDLFDAPQGTIDALHADGRVVICYFSAGSFEDWRPDAGDFPEAVKGDELTGWPGENWLDIQRLDLLGPIMEARLDLAQQKGCDGVEPDNVDGYTHSTGFSLSYQDQLDYNMWIAEQAHARGLSVGLKNDLDQVEDLVQYFDWALNESCFLYDECSQLQPFIDAGKAVFGVEYDRPLNEFCTEANQMNFDWLKKNPDLDAYRESCR